jgi:very-short-patch-repair endonuclease
VRFQSRIAAALCPHTVIMAAGSAKGARRKRAVRAAWLWGRSAGAVVTGEAAAFCHGMLDRAPASVELTLPRAAHRRGRPGVEMRRRDLQAPDVIERREIAVADAPLAALATAVALPRGSVFLDRALQRHVRFPAVYRCYCRNVGRHGSAAMHRMLVAAADRADSAAERLLVRLLREAGIGGWVLGYPFGPYRIDLAFPAERVAIEVDGWAWHVDAERSQGDHRTVALRLTGRAPTQARQATRGSRQVTTLSVVVPSLGVKPPESTYAAEPTAAEWGSPSGWIIRRGTRCCPSAERFSGEGVLVGALVHLPITAGIVVITTTVGFRGTWLIAWLMLLGLAYLICWDWHRVKALWGPELLPADVQR